MPRGSDVPPLRGSADIYSASRSGREAVALRPLARGEGDQPKGRHLRAVRPAGHACGRLTRVEAQRLIAALLAFLASTTGTSEMADRPDPLTIPDSPTDAKVHGSEVSSTVLQRAARHSVGLRRTRIKPITARTVPA
jgi:hypothetical protein